MCSKASYGLLVRIACLMRSGVWGLIQVLNYPYKHRGKALYDLRLSLFAGNGCWSKPSQNAGKLIFKRSKRGMKVQGISPH